MLQYKAKYFYSVILTIAMLSFITHSDAGNDCVWCDTTVSQNFLQCVIQEIDIKSTVKDSASTLKEVKTALLGAANAIKTAGLINDSTMKNALTFTLGKITNTNKNPDQKIVDIVNIMQQCCRILRINADIAFFDEIKNNLKLLPAKNGNLFETRESNDRILTEKLPLFRQNIKYPSFFNNIPQQSGAISNAEVKVNQFKSQLNGFTPGKEQTFQFERVPKQQESYSNFDGNRFYPNQGVKNLNVLPSNNQQPFQYNNAPQTVETLSTASGNNFYQIKEKNPFNKFLIDKQRPQEQRFVQGSSINQGNANAVAFNTDSTYGETSAAKQQPSLLNESYVWNNQKQQIPNVFNANNQQYSNQGKTNAFQNTYQPYPLNTEQISDYSQKTETWNNVQNSQLEKKPIDFYPQNQNADNSKYSINTQPKNSNSWSNSVTTGVNFPYTYNKLQNNNDLIQSYPNSFIYYGSQINNGYNSNSPAVNAKQNDGNYIDNSKSKVPQNALDSIYVEKTILNRENAPQVNLKQQNLPLTEENKLSIVKKLTESLFKILYKATSFKKVFNKYTPKSKILSVVPYMIYDSFISCGYPGNIVQEIATNTISFMKEIPEKQSTISYAKAICKLIMKQCILKKLLGNNFTDKTQDILKAMLVSLKKLEKPRSEKDDFIKHVTVTSTQQIIPNEDDQLLDNTDKNDDGDSFSNDSMDDGSYVDSSYSDDSERDGSNDGGSKDYGSKNGASDDGDANVGPGDDGGVNLGPDDDGVSNNKGSD